MKHFRKWFEKLPWFHIKYSERLKIAFFIFANFWVTKFKSFSKKTRRSFQDHCSFEALYKMVQKLTLEATESPEHLKIAFFTILPIFKWPSWSSFCGKWGKLISTFSTQVVHKKYFRKRFWSYLDVKTECCEPLKMSFFSFLQSFEWQSWNRFLGKWDKAFKPV